MKRHKRRRYCRTTMNSFSVHPHHHCRSHFQILHLLQLLRLSLLQFQFLHRHLNHLQFHVLHHRRQHLPRDQIHRRDPDHHLNYHHLHLQSLFHPQHLSQLHFLPLHLLQNPSP
ncbi:hypothetical protein NMG60_11035424 [Bertholletia excelsa]